MMITLRTLGQVWEDGRLCVHRIGYHISTESDVMRSRFLTLFAVLLLLTVSYGQTHSSGSEQLNYLRQTTPSGAGNGTSLNGSFGPMAWELAVGAGGTNSLAAYDMVVDSHDNKFLTGQYEGTATFGNITVQADGWDIFVAKLSSNGTWLWVAVAGGYQGESDGASSIALDSNGNALITGYFQWSATFGNFTINAAGSTSDIFVAKISSNGTWLWAKREGNSGIESASAIAVDANGDAYITGSYNCGSGGFVVGSDTLWYCNDPSGTWATAIFVIKISGNGTWLWGKSSSHASALPWNQAGGITLDSSGFVYISGSYYGSATFGNTQLTANEANDIFVAKLNHSGTWIWAVKAGAANYYDHAHDLVVASNGDVYVTGQLFDTTVSTQLAIFGNHSISKIGMIDIFLAKLASNGTWMWAKRAGGTSTDIPSSIAIDAYDDVYLTGRFELAATFGINFIGGIGNADVFVAKADSDGNWIWAEKAGSGSNDDAYAISLNNNGEVYVTGQFTQLASFGIVSLYASSSSTDIFVGKLSADYDSDGEPNSLDDDDDGDNVPDFIDNCIFSPLDFYSAASVDNDGDGCRDSDEDDDDDGDSLIDGDDDCPIGVTGWISNNATDFDGDGCNDAIEDDDDDNDGIADFLDLCPKEEGNSTFEYEEGCPDTDGDGRPDIRDLFVNDSSEWADLDGDGVGDNADVFDADSTQHSDSDGDGYGDYLYGNGGDGCPHVWGDSVIDLLGCPDSDADGWSDIGDPLPFDSTQYSDRDGDGYGDNQSANATMSDVFPNDASQWADTDGDGYGDEIDGNRADAFPNDPAEWMDSDADGLGNNADDFPFDPTQTVDADGDGMGDNPMGIGADKFPDDATQWGDIDGDGYGDNLSGNNPDAFFTDSTQWSDSDGDGYGDNPAGRLYDLFPNNPTQWEDNDGDGLGDNLAGTDADPYLNDFDNDGYNDSIDILPKLASPGDLDNDGCMDENDTFPADAKECRDFDGDGVGDNEDTDDDGDGWADTDEMRLGTDPFSSAEEPVETFELVMPGTTIGLGAWDLIGMLGGIPLGLWILSGLLTRNGRTRAYEKRLFEARTEEELSEISDAYEWSLMWKMVGPHQALRLERIRSNLEVKFNQMLQPDSGIDQTSMVETSAPDSSMAGTVGTDGYEWMQEGGANWYRPAHTGGEWTRWQ